MAVADVARAYAVTRDAFGLRSLWTAIQDLDNQVPAVLQGEMILAARDLVQHATLWFLRNAPKPLDIAATIETYQPGIAALEDGLEDFLGEIDAVVLADKCRHYQDQGVPDALARRIAALEVLASAPDIVLSAAQCERPVDEVACVYFAVGGMAWMVSAMSDSRGRAVGIALGIVLASVILNFLAQFWPLAESISFLSVLTYYRPFLILSGSTWPTGDLFVLGAAGVAFWSIGAIIFVRRDVCTV